jgi:cysteine-rich repeat protein
MVPLIDSLRKMPTPLKVLFSVFAIVPFWSLTLDPSPWTFYAEGQFVRAIILAFAYWIGPLLIMVTLLVRNFLFLPVLASVCFTLILIPLLNFDHHSAGFLAIRFILLVIMGASGFIVLTRDNLFPFLVKHQRHWRRAVRLSANKKLTVRISDQHNFDAIMQDISLTGLCFLSSAVNYEKFAKHLKKDDFVNLRAEMGADTLDIHGRLKWTAQHGKIRQFGIAVESIETMERLMAGLRLNSNQSPFTKWLTINWARTGFRRCMLACWGFALAANFVMPACGVEHKNNTSGKAFDENSESSQTSDPASDEQEETFFGLIAENIEISADLFQVIVDVYDPESKITQVIIEIYEDDFGAIAHNLAEVLNDFRTEETPMEFSGIKLREAMNLQNNGVVKTRLGLLSQGILQAIQAKQGAGSQPSGSTCQTGCVNCSLCQITLDAFNPDIAEVVIELYGAGKLLNITYPLPQIIKPVTVSISQSGSDPIGNPIFSLSGVTLSPSPLSLHFKSFLGVSADPDYDTKCTLILTCGNGIQEGAEQCDDGNLINGDGCDNICQIELVSCGNGTLEGAEQCDDGNLFDWDGCSSTCQFDTVGGPICGDSIPEGAEQCDDGNLVNGDGCSDFCQNETVICGNGTLEGSEQCDDGNLIDWDGCSSTCQFDTVGGPICGDSIPEGAEQCDDGNLVNGDGCDDVCQSEAPSGGCSTLDEEASCSTNTNCAWCANENICKDSSDFCPNVSYQNCDEIPDQTQCSARSNCFWISYPESCMRLQEVVCENFVRADCTSNTGSLPCRWQNMGGIGMCSGGSPQP